MREGRTFLFIRACARTIHYWLFRLTVFGRRSRSPFPVSRTAGFRTGSIRLLLRTARLLLRAARRSSGLLGAAGLLAGRSRLLLARCARLLLLLLGTAGLLTGTAHARLLAHLHLAEHLPNFHQPPAILGRVPAFVLGNIDFDGIPRLRNRVLIQ